jgi:hypothetical protein
MVMKKVDAVQKLKITIDPLLKERYGPEICWTWRLLLSGMGFPWEEVSAGSLECDIAYGTEPVNAGHSRLCVRANTQFWDQRSSQRLRAVGYCDGWSYPLFEDEQQRNQLFYLSDGCLVCDRDLIFDVFWLATGQEEHYWPKNQHGHFDLGGTTFQREQALRLAVASSIGSELRKTLMNLGFAAPIPQWPHGKRAAACVSHDVDYPEAVGWLEPLRIIHRQGLRGLSPALSVVTGSRHHWHFASWVQLEKRLGTRSAFFFVARRGSLLEYTTGTPDSFYDVQSDRFRKLFKYLIDEGCEIGLHASYRAFERRDKFAAEKRILEEASAQIIRGNRQHYWHLNPDDPESTLLLHEQLGLQYDTSLTHERYLGWRRGLSWPFFPFHQKERRELKVLQISTVWMDDHLFGHRLDNPGDRFDILSAVADRTAKQGGCLLIDVHEYVFDDVLFPGWATTYRQLLECLTLRSDFWIGTPGEIANHWIERYALILQRSRGLIGTASHA